MRGNTRNRASWIRQRRRRWERRYYYIRSAPRLDLVRDLLAGWTNRRSMTRTVGLIGLNFRLVRPSTHTQTRNQGNGYHSDERADYLAKGCAFSTPDGVRSTFLDESRTSKKGGAMRPHAWVSGPSMINVHLLLSISPYTLFLVEGSRTFDWRARYEKLVTSVVDSWGSMLTKRLREQCLMYCTWGRWSHREGINTCWECRARMPECRGKLFVELSSSRCCEDDVRIGAALVGGLAVGGCFPPLHDF